MVIIKGEKNTMAEEKKLQVFPVGITEKEIKKIADEAIAEAGGGSGGGGEVELPFKVIESITADTTIEELQEALELATPSPYSSKNVVFYLQEPQGRFTTGFYAFYVSNYGSLNYSIACLYCGQEWFSFAYGSNASAKVADGYTSSTLQKICPATADLDNDKIYGLTAEGGQIYWREATGGSGGTTLYVHHLSFADIPDLYLINANNTDLTGTDAGSSSFLSIVNSSVKFYTGNREIILNFTYEGVKNSYCYVAGGATTITKAEIPSNTLITGDSISALE